MEYQLKDFDCCPKCCGHVVHDDCFIEHANVWLRYIKCINCGWRYEVKTPFHRKMVVLK
jgi:transcription elongation factor Elf1